MKIIRNLTLIFTFIDVSLILISSYILGAEPGVMQLVPKYQHTNFKGNAFWKTMNPGNKGDVYLGKRRICVFKEKWVG